MNTTTPEKTSPSNPWRQLRRCLVGLAVCLTLICLYYTEELWRGQRDWAIAKSRLEAKGVNLNWTANIPAPVPDDQNVFGVPEMQKWFVGRGDAGWIDLCKKMSSMTYPGISMTNSPRMVVAELTTGLPGTPMPDGVTALRWDDPASRTEAAGVLTNVLGPTTSAPESVVGLGLILRSPAEIRPARIFLQCQTAPTEQQLQQFLPDAIFHAHTYETNRLLNFERDGQGSYHVTMPKLVKVGDYLAWSDQLQPPFSLIRQALQRPYARMEANYVEPIHVPIPCFVSVRHFEQILGARAECHFLLGQPEEALPELTLIHESCHPLMEQNQPMTLVGAMINVAVRGLYANVVDDGLRLHVWREPQLAALEEQLKTINVLPAVKKAFEMERVSSCRTLETMSPVELMDLFMDSSEGGKTNAWKVLKNRVLGALLPRGWLYQNMVTGANLNIDFEALVDSGGGMIYPDKVEALQGKLRALSHGSPYAFFITISTPNYLRAWQATAHGQTQVNQALIVCALERYHLAHGDYPEKLESLMPQYLDDVPHDVIGGQPPHYRRAADGTFVLYSIGWSGRDHNGAPGNAIYQPYSFTDGDWIWPD